MKTAVGVITRFLYALAAVQLLFTSACYPAQATTPRQHGLLAAVEQLDPPGGASAARALSDVGNDTRSDTAADKAWVLSVNGSLPDASGSTRRGKGTGGWPRVIRGVGSDGADGVFVSGSFFGEVELEGIGLASNGRSDVLLGRIDAAGRVLWLHGFGGTGIDIAPDIVADSRGRALVTGMVSAGARAAGQIIETAGGSDAFTAQLSPAGDILWLRTAGGKKADSGNEIATDNDDNVLVAANSYGAVAAGGNAVEHRGGMDGFLLKYDASGQLLWLRQIAGPADDQLRGIAADSSGNVAVVGEFSGTVDLGRESLHAAGSRRDVLVARYTPLGVLLWSRRFGGDGEDYARGVDVDASGNVYVTGVFTGSVDFGGVTLDGGSNREQLFVMRLSPSGDVHWARAITGSGSGHGCELDVTDSGRVVIGCDVMGELGVDGMSVKAAGRRDSFVAVFDSDGNPRNLIALGAEDAAASFDIVGDTTGSYVTLVGAYEGALLAGSGRMPSASGSSAYIARIALGGTASEDRPRVTAADTSAPARFSTPGDRRLSTGSRRVLPENPDPGYAGAPAGPLQTEEFTITIPAERWQKEMALRVYAPVDGGPYPVIVFCAGSGGENSTYRPTSEYLASHGYVVIHNSYARQRGLGNENLTRNRVLDIYLVLDALDNSSLPFRGRIDSGKIGAMGHSSGAYITQLLGGAVVRWGGREENFRDARIDAIVMYSGQGSGQQGLTRESWRQMNVPMMAVTGSSDRGAFSQDPSWRREPFELSPGPGKYLVWYDRGHHGSFSGRFARNEASRAIFEHAQQMTLKFFDAFLKGDAQARDYLNSSQPESLNGARVDYSWK